MSGINYFDTAVIVIILFSTSLAYFRGVVREVMAILGWLVSAIGAYIVAPATYPVLKTIPALNSIIQSSCELGVLIAFAISLVILLLIMSFITAVLSRVAKLPVLNALDKLFGLLFGAARGGLIVTIAVIAIEAFLPTGAVLNEVTNSTSSQIFGGLQDMITAMIPESAPQWLSKSYQNLMQSCEVGV